MMAVAPILLVDNDPSHLKLLKLTLAGNGYDIRTASNADETMKILEGFHPHLILMEIQLPGKDGFDLLRKLKSDPNNHKIVTVAVTAYGMEEDKEMVMDAGFDGYIAKPIDIDTFPKTVAHYLDKYGNITEEP